MPLTMPIPRKTSTDWRSASPTPPSTRPVPKQSAAALAAARGPPLDPRTAERGAQAEQRQRGGEVVWG